MPHRRAFFSQSKRFKSRTFRGRSVPQHPRGHRRHHRSREYYADKHRARNCDTLARVRRQLTPDILLRGERMRRVQTSAETTLSTSLLFAFLPFFLSLSLTFFIHFMTFLANKICISFVIRLPPIFFGTNQPPFLIVPRAILICEHHSFVSPHSSNRVSWRKDIQNPIKFYLARIHRRFVSW